MKIAYVIVRYGEEILGGAEQGCRMLAERLVADVGWKVDVYTTCAVDHQTWADVLPPGRESLNGVTVHRFRSTAGRHKKFGALSDRLLSRPDMVKPGEAEKWIALQGPVCPLAIEAATQSDADLIVFYPYLYWPTVHGMLAATGRAVLHPAAHDEPAIHLPIFRQVFAQAKGLVFQTDAERRFVESLFPSIRLTRQILLGLGVEELPGEAAVFRERFNIGDRPYLLCLGRVDDGKGTGALAKAFMTYKRRRQTPIALVFAGPVANLPPAHPDIITTGALSEEGKWGALRGAMALINPSLHEAFSIVLMEAWTAGLPVLVNGRCGATAEHARRSGGGLSFRHYAEFEVALDRLVGDPPEREALGRAGAAYVRQNFNWPILIERYARFLAQLASVPV